VELASTGLAAGAMQLPVMTFGMIVLLDCCAPLWLYSPLIFVTARRGYEEARRESNTHYAHGLSGSDQLLASSTVRSHKQNRLSKWA
jgi:hypothetical protein